MKWNLRAKKLERGNTEPREKAQKNVVKGKAVGV